MDEYTYNRILKDHGRGAAERYKAISLGFSPQTNRKKHEFRNDNYTWEGISLPAEEWAKRLGIQLLSFYRRLREWGFCEKSFTYNHKNPLLMSVTYQGKTQTIREWCKEVGITENLFRRRLKVYGYDDINILLSPMRYQKITYGGKTLTRQQWADELNISLQAFTYRFNKYGICTKTFCDKRSNSFITYNGITKTAPEWAKLLNISVSAFYARIKKRGDKHPLVFKSKTTAGRNNNGKSKTYSIHN